MSPPLKLKEAFKRRRRMYLSVCFEENVKKEAVKRDDTITKKGSFLIPPPTLRELTISKQKEDMITAEQEYKHAENKSKSSKPANKKQMEDRIFSFE
jgi:hypothetical protein